MKNIIDTSGLSCPQPMLEVKNFMDNTSKTSVSVLIDNEASLENIRRLAKQRGWKVAGQEMQNGNYLLTLEKI